MCGIVGIVGVGAVNQRLYDALTVLQHRGQDAAGITTCGEGELYVRKGSGLVRDVFQQHHMLELKGNVGIGHVRYPTAGCDSASEAQPFYVNAPYGICLGHNGNLTNATELAEAVFSETQGRLHTPQCGARPRHAACIFEYVYFARHDSKIDNSSVYRARMRMGDRLADKILRERPRHDIDVVIPVPDTSRTSALQLAQRLSVKYREGFIKNRYIGRTFIMPGQDEREKSVRRKLNAIDLEFRGKTVLLIDDSIVRGTTSAQIIELAREAGAKKVYFASAAPPVRFPNVYGIDMPAASELVASGRTVEEVARLIGADWLVYQDLTDLIAACKHEDARIEEFDTSCFSGEYVTGDVTPEYLGRLQLERSDAAKHARRERRGKLKVVRGS